MASPDSEPRPSFTCPRCLWVSYHPDDLTNGYCGHCHDYTAPAVHPSRG
jgi:hypothetical protein